MGIQKELMKVSLFVARAEMCFIRSYYQQTRRIVRGKKRVYKTKSTF